MLPYQAYKFLYPPRPTTKIGNPTLNLYQNKGWLAQKKKNGTNTLVFCKGDTVVFKTRHNEDHKLWVPQPDHIKFFQGFDDWQVFCGEILHSKVAGGPKNHYYIFDQIVRDGKFLYGETFAARYAAMFARFFNDSTASADDCYFLTERITLARNFQVGFSQIFATGLKKEDEGLVLKDPKGRLGLCTKNDNNGEWQVKCRIPNANYSF